MRFLFFNFFFTIRRKEQWKKGKKSDGNYNSVLPTFFKPLYSSNDFNFLIEVTEKKIALRRLFRGPLISAVLRVLPPKSTFICKTLKKSCTATTSLHGGIKRKSLVYFRPKMKEEKLIKSYTSVWWIRHKPWHHPLELPTWTSTTTL